ncbi:MAG: PTS glucose transporter subunit IIA [Lachnospiraceae bacterium]|nr:PTS glucose transporter subunit IIA [Lachnospiraceae bacterium]
MGLFDKILKKKEAEVVSPAAGRCVSIKKVPDPTFGEEIMGKGVAIEPADGKFYAPADGVVSTLFPTLHAIGITTPEGVEILLHVGLDTVKLNGKHFTVHVKQDDQVKKGDLILEADLAAIAAEGYQTITPVLVCNTPDFKEVVPVAEKDVAAGDVVLQIKL